MQQQQQKTRNSGEKVEEKKETKPINIIPHDAFQFQSSRPNSVVTLWWTCYYQSINVDRAQQARWWECVETNHERWLYGGGSWIRCRGAWVPVGVGCVRPWAWVKRVLKRRVLCDQIVSHTESYGRGTRWYQCRLRYVMLFVCMFYLLQWWHTIERERE